LNNPVVLNKLKHAFPLSKPEDLLVAKLSEEMQSEESDEDCQQEAILNLYYASSIGDVKVCNNLSSCF